MDKIFEALAELIPLAGLFQNLGLDRNTSVALSSLIIITFFMTLAILLKYLKEHYRNFKVARDLAPYFDCRKVKASRRYFIPTKFQNESPTREEEPGFSHKFVSKSLLIPFCMKTAFNEKKESDKFYLILADSGMGKTTFMINLYVQYTSFFNFGRKYKMRLYPFGDARILDQIKQIDREEARQTILLLDAFDEDKKLIPPVEPDGMTDDERFRRRLDEIIETVQDFREVVITSRTQYFPGQEHEPYELKIPRFDEQGFHKLAKLYLSPFDDKEIKRYLNKKYGILRFWNRKKKHIATTIVTNAPKLMVRPMLLSYIDYLTDHQHVFTSTYEIYETLVEKWIEREAAKRKHQTKDREVFRKELDSFSRLVAVEIMHQCQYQQADLLCVKKETAVAIARDNKLDLRDYEITGQSLLTRDVEGNWKFAHKSIYEFLIAREAVENLVFRLCLNIVGMDMTKEFLLDNPPYMFSTGYFKFIKGGSFLMGSPAGETNRSDDETQHQVKVGDFYLAKYPVTVAEFEIFIRESNYSIDWHRDSKGEFQKDKNHPVTNVSWNDVSAYCEWLGKKLEATFRLPTEAEWEYTCRAGTVTPFNIGESLTTDQANYLNRIGGTTPVGAYPPNAWGLYDMHGNVGEWCGDWYGEKYFDECKKQGIVDNPTGPETGSRRVLRGGSWRSGARRCRSAYRGYYDPGYRYDFIGFRLVFVPQSVGSLRKCKE